MSSLSHIYVHSGFLCQASLTGIQNATPVHHCTLQEFQEYKVKEKQIQCDSIIHCDHLNQTSSLDCTIPSHVRHPPLLNSPSNRPSLLVLLSHGHRKITIFSLILQRYHPSLRSQETLRPLFLQTTDYTVTLTSLVSQQELGFMPCHNYYGT